jgi:hypothetical protein
LSRTHACRIEPDGIYITGVRSYYQQHPAEATRFLAVGEYPLPLDIKKEELAAQTEVVHTLFNLDETIVKN